MQELFSMEKLEKAIAEKDYISAKSYVTTAMRLDTRFESGTCQKMLALLDAHLPEIFEEEEILSGEERRSDPAQWDKGYYVQLIVCFKSNFAKSRLSHIREVGRKVYPAPAPNPQPKTQPNTQPSGGVRKAPPSKASQTKDNSTKTFLAIAGLLAAVIAVVLLLIKLL